MPLWDSRQPPEAAAKTLLCCGHWLGHGLWPWLPTLLLPDGGGAQDVAHIFRQRPLAVSLTAWVPGPRGPHFDAQLAI